MTNQTVINDRLTVGQTMAIYKDKRYNYINEIKTRINSANNREVVFFNDNYLNALCLSHVMLNRTKASLSIISGINILAFLKILSEPFLDLVNRIKDAGKIRFLVLAPYDFKNDDKLESQLLEFAKSIKIKIRKPQPHLILHHAIISDSRDYRLEALHNEITEDSNANEIHAKVVFNGRKAFWLQNQFDILFDSEDPKYFLK